MCEGWGGGESLDVLDKLWTLYSFIMLFIFLIIIDLIYSFDKNT